VDVDVDVEGGWGNADTAFANCNVNVNTNCTLREAAKPLGCTTAAAMRLPLRLPFLTIAASTSKQICPQLGIQRPNHTHHQGPAMAEVFAETGETLQRKGRITYGELIL
jgi:hypothetical protein